MKRLFAVLLGCLVSTGAYAQQSSVPKEITGYKNLTVSFSKSAGDCNLKDETLFVNGNDILAFEFDIKNDIKMMKKVTAMMSGGAAGAPRFANSRRA